MDDTLPWILTLLSLLSVLPLASSLPSIAIAHEWIPYQTDVAYYPYVVHLPDRSTRNLPPLAGLPPLLFSLSGSGARGNASMAGVLAGYDGASRKIREYNAGNTTGLPYQLAAEEFLTVVPIAPDDTPQDVANWNTSVLPEIISHVASQYQVDFTRVYFSSYSMGSRAAWSIAMDNPDIWAGMIISSGSTAASPTQLTALLGIPIRNYYGSDDEGGLDILSQTTQMNYNQALTLAPPGVNVNEGSLETIVVLGADHLTMTDRPWDEDVLCDGNPGALSWLLKQQRVAPAQLPALVMNSSSSSSTSKVSPASTSTSPSKANLPTGLTSGAAKMDPSSILLMMIVGMIVLQ